MKKKLTDEEIGQAIGNLAKEVKRLTELFFVSLFVYMLFL